MFSSSMLLRLGAELAALLTSAVCAGCDTPGDLLCPPCRSALLASPAERITPDGLSVSSALVYEGVAARCIRRVKEDGQTHLIRPLGDALSSVLAMRDVTSTMIVPVPTSRRAFRRRGYRVPDLLIRGAGAIPRRLLSVGAAPRDQRGLGAQDRRDNIRGTMRARRAGGGDEVVIVDDVITTGASLDEAARGLRAAGFQVVGAVTLAATPLHGIRRGSIGD